MAISKRELDLEFVRKQFPAFAEPKLEGQAFFENAGGSYACRQTIFHLGKFYRESKVQPYYPYPASQAGGDAMDRSYERMAAYLNVNPDEVHFGPSTTQNTYVLAQAMREWLKPGDEIIVTNQDHEANIGAWRRLGELGVKVKEWKVDATTGQLSHKDLLHMLNERTRLVAVTHCSNIVGQMNPVAKYAHLAHAVGALVVVDGVSAAPHGLPDVRSLDCDIYLFSLYKTFGPHQGVMVVRRRTLDKLSNQSHFFNADSAHKRLNPAGPDHAQVAAAQGVTDYFDALYDHHFDPSQDNEWRAQKVRQLIADAERTRLQPLLEFLDQHPKVQLIGSSDVADRAPTCAIRTLNQTPEQLVRKLTMRGIMSGYGNFYASRLMSALGVDPEEGVARFSLVHYTSDDEVQQLIEGLHRVLG